MSPRLGLMVTSARGTQVGGGEMNGHRYLILLLAFGCIIAVGTSATTLNSSLSTDPDDVIDIEYKYLPVGEDTGERLKQAGQADASGQERAQTSGGGGDDQARNEQSDDAGGSQGSSGQDGADLSPGSGQSQTQGPGMGEALQSLLDLLRRLLVLLVALVALALAYRYRDRLLGLVLVVDEWFVDRSETRRGSVTSPWPRTQPTNDVHRAWLAMVQRANPDRPRSRTPAECARAAIDAGLDSETVESLTTLFEEVRYGDRPVTDERCERAREGLRDLDRHTAPSGGQPGSIGDRRGSTGDRRGSIGGGRGLTGDRHGSPGPGTGSDP